MTIDEISGMHAQAAAVKSDYKFLIRNYGFRLESEAYFPELLGAFKIVLASDRLRFLYVSEKSIVIVGMSPIFAPEDGTDAGEVRSLVLGDNRPDRIISVEEFHSFFRDNHEAIYDLWSEANYPQTKQKLIGLRKLRVQLQGWSPSPR
jgi:hypothetical protein